MFIKALAALSAAITLASSVSGMTLTEDFNTGTLNGFTAIKLGDASVVNGGPGGASDPYMQVVDAGSGFMEIVFNTDWIGDLSAFDEGIFSFDFIQTDQSANGGFLEGFGTLLLEGVNRTVGADLVPVDPSSAWQSASAVIDADAFGVTQAQWEDVLNEVTQFSLRVESWVNPSETIGVDNFRLQSTMAPVPLPAGSLLLLSGLGALALRRRVLR